jgi:hypothetical protein
MDAAVKRLITVKRVVTNNQPRPFQLYRFHKAPCGSVISQTLWSSLVCYYDVYVNKRVVALFGMSSARLIGSGRVVEALTIR